MLHFNLFLHYTPYIKFRIGIKRQNSEFWDTIIPSVCVSVERSDLCQCRPGPPSVCGQSVTRSSQVQVRAETHRSGIISTSSSAALTSPINTNHDNF